MRWIGQALYCVRQQQRCSPGSITVAADTCTQAGMLSTVSMLEGGAAEAFLEEQGVDYWCER